MSEKKAEAASPPENEKAMETGEKAENGDWGSNRLRVVGVGASAGGIEPLERLFAATPPDLPLAFVVVQHLDPRHKSHMAAILNKKSKLTASDIEDGTRVSPGHIHVLPPGNHVIIKNATLYLKPAERSAARRNPIDIFFSSLAEDQKENAVCIILSGAGTDGTRGAQSIKEAGGMVLAQTEEQAKYPQMPQSVIDAGAADFVMSVENMPERLMKLVHVSSGEIEHATCSWKAFCIRSPKGKTFVWERSWT